MSPDTTTPRPPPASLATEQALLGLVLRGEAAWPSELVSPADFVDAGHTAVATAMRALADMGQDCDMPLVEAALETAGRLEDVGGHDYLVRLFAGTATVARLGDYCTTVRADAARRRAHAAIDRGDLGAARDHIEAAAGSGTHSATLRPVPLDSLMVLRAPIRWAIENYLPRGLVTMLGAHGGMGKSYLALAFAALVACGREFAGHAVYCGKALYVSLEDDEDMVLDRLRRIVLAYGLDPETVKANVTILTGTHGDCAMAIEGGHGKRLTATRLMDEVKAAAVGHSLVVIDNASDGFAGNENDRGQVRAFMRMLADIARHTTAAVLLLAHIDKASAKFGAQGNSYSGSTAWHNSARSRLALAKRDGVTELCQEKLTVGREAEPIVLAWTKDAVLAPAGLSGASAPQGDTNTATRDADAVLTALRAANAAAVNVTPARQGQATSYNCLATFDELPKDLRGPRGKDRFWSALNKLLADGRVEVEDYMNASRKPATRLRAISDCANIEGQDLDPCANTGARAHSPTPPSAYSRTGLRDMRDMENTSDIAHIAHIAQPSEIVGNGADADPGQFRASAGQLGQLTGLDHGPEAETAAELREVDL